MQTFSAAGFQKCRQAQLLQKRMYQFGGLLNCFPFNAFTGIEVEHHPIGSLQRIRGRVERVNFHHVPLRRRQQALFVGDLQ